MFITITAITSLLVLITAVVLYKRKAKKVTETDSRQEEVTPTDTIETSSEHEETQNSQSIDPKAARMQKCQAVLQKTQADYHSDKLQIVLTKEALTNAMTWSLETNTTLQQCLHAFDTKAVFELNAKQIYYHTRFICLAFLQEATGIIKDVLKPSTTIKLFFLRNMDAALKITVIKHFKPSNIIKNEKAFFDNKGTRVKGKFTNKDIKTADRYHTDIFKNS